MASMLAKSGLLAVSGSLIESKFGPKDAKLGGLSPLVLLGTGFWVITFGFKVGAARSKAIKDAEADGEADVKERYALPNLYAQGTSKHARIFNCVQRAHQHIYESLPVVILSSLVAAAEYPITSSLLTLVYSVGRYHLSDGYAKADGDASKRYASPLAVGTWYGLVSLNVLGMLASLKMLLPKIMW